MSVERSAGAVIYCETKMGWKYLLLHHLEGLPPVGKKGYWNFPKGHIERGETPAEAARREILEETGLRDVEFVGGFREREHYGYMNSGKKISKFVVWFLARSREKNITLSDEHTEAVWLSYEKASKKISYLGTKLLLKKAHRFLVRTK